MKLKKIIGNLLLTGNKNAPTILTSITIVGVFGTAASAYVCGIRAHDIIERHKEDMEIVDPDDVETKRTVMKETVIDILPTIIPPLILASFTATCAFMSNSINSKRLAVLGTAYAISERRVKEYEDKMKEIIGDQRTRDVQDAVVKEKVTPVMNNIDAEEFEYASSKGKVIAIDGYSGDTTLTNATLIGQAVNKLSSRIRTEMYIPLNDFYDEIGIKRKPMGDDFGWNIDDCIDGSLPITYTAVLNDAGYPCIGIDYDIWPRQDFRELGSR